MTGSSLGELGAASIAIKTDIAAFMRHVGTTLGLRHIRGSSGLGVF